MSLRSELKELLKKYQATIMFECGECSDMHGIYDERIEVIDKNNKVIITASGFSMDASDI